MPRHGTTAYSRCSGFTTSRFGAAGPAAGRPAGRVVLCDMGLHLYANCLVNLVLGAPLVRCPLVVRFSMDSAAAPPPSLVKYESPLGIGDDAAGGIGKTKSGSSKAVDVHLEEILNSVLPPRCASTPRSSPFLVSLQVVVVVHSMWTQEDSSTWMQYVAKDAASRLDVITLQETLDQRLMQRQAREMGICPVREDLYSQAFGARPLETSRFPCPFDVVCLSLVCSCDVVPDELIRQVTIESPERGLLLLRVRDEIRMTMDAYKTLYDSRFAQCHLAAPPRCRARPEPPAVRCLQCHIWCSQKAASRAGDSGAGGQGTWCCCFIVAALLRHASIRDLCQVEELQSTKKDLENTVISLRNQVEVRQRHCRVFGVHALGYICRIGECLCR